MNPLAQLKDIHLPGAVSAWPPAFGWWLLMLLVIGAIVASVTLFRRYKRARRAQKQALSILNAINGTQSDWPQQLNGVLKRLAIRYFPNHDIAAMHSSQWSEFLISRLPSKKQKEFKAVISPMQETLYRNSTDNLRFEACQRQIKLWITSALPPSRKKLEADNV
jgi:hypothetical protein